jgi:hypothetical protein
MTAVRITEVRIDDPDIQNLPSLRGVWFDWQ